MKRGSFVCLMGLSVGALPCVLGQEPDIRVDVRLVRIPFVAEDSTAKPIRDLRPEDLILKVDGVKQDVRYLWTELDLPLTVALIIDVSSSQMGFVQAHRKSVDRFITRIIGPKDRVLLATVDEQPRLLTDLTRDTGELLQTAELIRQERHAGAPLGEPCVPPRQRGRRRGAGACIGTAIWDGVFHVVRERLVLGGGRKAVVLLSDGLDLNASVHALSTAIEAAQSAGVTVYTIRYLSGPYLALAPPLLLSALRDHAMEQIAAQTGGLSFKKPADLNQVYDRIEEDLRSQYVLAYRPESASASTTLHKIQIQTVRQGAKVRAQSEYRLP